MIERNQVIEMIRGIAKLTDVQTIPFKLLPSEKIAERLLDRLDKIDDFCEKCEKILQQEPAQP